MTEFFPVPHFIRASLGTAMVFGALIVALSGSSVAQAEYSALKEAGVPSTEPPKGLTDVGITEKLKQKLNLSLKFKDENGQEVTLGHYYDGKHPVVISLVYYSCPGLCNFHLNGVVDALKNVDWSAGDQFQYLAISFDPKEGPVLAKAKKASYMKVYERPGTENGWHFLTGDEATIHQLAEQIGFKYKWVPEEKQWAHASAAVVTMPDGEISRYLHGIMFDGKTFKLALVEAAEGKVGTLADKLIWYCFHYDPHQSKYTLYATRVMQMGGVGIILVLGLILIPVWIRSRREHS
jgi:protein SCO1/2